MQLKNSSTASESEHARSQGKPINDERFMLLINFIIYFNKISINIYSDFK